MEDRAIAKRVTLSDIAQRAGVSVSTVCDVLRNRQGKVRVSDRTKKRIFAVVKELNYQPQAAARALVTGKTMHIGFVLSASTPLGLTNYYYASLLAGVEWGCKERGYGCVVGTHDLSTTRDFVTPSKVATRSVDGLIICGMVEDEIMQVFVDCGIPFVLIGESTTYPRDKILYATDDLKKVWTRVFDFHYRQGHRKMLVGGISSQRTMRLLKEATAEYAATLPSGDMAQIDHCPLESAGADPFDTAYANGVEWTTVKDRPTAILGHAHFCAGFLGAILDAGFECPRDLSVACVTDDLLCQWHRPSITALSSRVRENSQAVTHLLVDLLEEKIDVNQARDKTKTIWQLGDFIERASSAPPPQR